MPIVDIEVVAGADCPPAPELAQVLADVVGAALQSPPGHTWVRLRALAPECYAENASRLEPNALPVFVAVMQRAPPQGARLAAQMQAVAAAVAEATGREVSRVHVEYAPAAAGRMGFGGRIVE